MSMPLRTAIKFQLYRSPLYRPIRLAFLAVADRPKLQSVRRAEALYRPFVPPGSLVFDIGANLGEYTETFATLGARVIAIEPNPALADKLKGLAARWPVTIEPVAVGAEQGIATLHMQAGRSDLSTISSGWKDTSGVGWTHAIEVPVTTVDALVAQYAPPHFLKIDTEGHDDEVVRTMTVRPPVVSFELLARDRAIAMRVLNTLGSRYQYNYTLGESFTFDQPWMSAEAMRTVIATVPCPNGYGDIFARQ